MLVLLIWWLNSTSTLSKMHRTEAKSRIFAFQAQPHDFKPIVNFVRFVTVFPCCMLSIQQERFPTSKAIVSDGLRRAIRSKHSW